MKTSSDRAGWSRIPVLARVLLSVCGALLLALVSQAHAAAADPLDELVEVVPVEVGDVEEAPAPALGAVSDLAEPLVEDAAPAIQPIAPITEPIAPVEPLVDLVRDELPAPVLPPRAVDDTRGAATRPAPGSASPIDVWPEARSTGLRDGRHQSAPAGPPPSDAEPPFERGSTPIAAASVVSHADRLPSPLPSAALPILTDGGIAAVAGLSAGLSFAALMACVGLAMAHPIRQTGLQLVPPVPPG